MKFYPLTQTAPAEESLAPEYKTGREIGKIRLGSEHFFFRSGLKTYYIPYGEVKRCFRRVMLIPAKLCCGKGDFEVENLVICDGEKELAQIQLPGTKAAKILMEELKQLMPNAEFTRAPEVKEGASEGSACTPEGKEE